MNATLVHALVLLVPVALLFGGSVKIFAARRNVPSLLQLLGAASLLIVVLTHFCEALHIFPWMKWGMHDSIGHYVDLCSALLGLTLFPLGFFIQTFARRSV